MTVCATEDSAALGSPPPAALTVAADGSYAARLARHEESGSWFPERWTLGGSGPYAVPYAVPLPGSQPEEPDSELLPLADGRVLILRRVADRFAVSLLYPAGPGTGELPLGAVQAPELTLLPPTPGGAVAYALAPGERSTAVWLVYGPDSGPGPDGTPKAACRNVAEVPGRCSGGVWLDRTGRLLALDREREGRTKTVVVDLGRDGETSPLLQITEESNDRLLLADPDSGLLVVRSDAPGHERLGWGVLGSARPVRFPDCLRLADAALLPFAAQPGRMLLPESCAVAFRIDGAAGTWLGLWRPVDRRLRQIPAPPGWLAGAGLWTADGELRLPYTTREVPCGVARMTAPPEWREGTETAVGTGSATGTGPEPGTDPEREADHGPAADPAAGAGPGSGPDSGSGPGSPPADGSGRTSSTSTQPESVIKEPDSAPAHPSPCRPVPLQQAPLAVREAR
ncbi:hypothetical protein [Streptomyces sp. MST-110588]|uniref:hypothetical protein n=1 Tax=Streptomyces sp. MST-110588 TaxID=2833628 RepID=UPI001F5E2D27|nr:hypothetical protein [Streptomyces sp. MST-110588]UNO42371.1 hypothetical protein KGS77_26155 [Streptomyces sp. MST-110588]